jgi:hypothetical protein
MNIKLLPAVFVADSGGSIETVRADDPRNLDLGATQPIDIPMNVYLGHDAGEDSLSAPVRATE